MPGVRVAKVQRRGRAQEIQPERQNVLKHAIGFMFSWNSPAAWRGETDAETEESAQKMKKAPKNGASKWNLCLALVQGAPELLLFLRSSLLLGGGFLVALFID